MKMVLRLGCGSGFATTYMYILTEKMLKINRLFIKNI